MAVSSSSQCNQRCTIRTQWESEIQSNKSKIYNSTQVESERESNKSMIYNLYTMGIWKRKQPVNDIQLVHNENMKDKATSQWYTTYTQRESEKESIQSMIYNLYTIRIWKRKYQVKDIQFFKLFESERVSNKSKIYDSYTIVIWRRK